MDIKEYKEKNGKELQKEVERLKKELHEVGFNIKSGQHKTTSDKNKLRKKIARILTVLSEKERPKIADKTK